MQLKTKITLLASALAVGMVLVLTLISLYSFREYSIASATTQVQTAAQILRAYLTESMVHGQAEQRDSFLSRLKEVEGYKSARVVRSPLLEKQFGQATPAATEPDSVELNVMATGRAVFSVDDEAGEAVFRGTLPYVASAHSKTDCLQCHQVKEGEVLGAISLTLSIEQLKHQALLTVAGIFATILAFSTFAVLAIRRILGPIAATARDVESAVQQALTGNFTALVAQRTSDEIGHIARDLNHLLQAVGDGLNRIAENVSHLIDRKPVAGENQINATIEMVEILTRAAHFKQAIEEDETCSEVHKRLVKVLNDDFFIDEFSLYQVVEGKNQMLPLIVDGKTDGDCRWCNPEILVRSEACRARRTGHPVDGLANPGICYAFQPPEDAPDRNHICLPIMQSGSVGDVLQIVTSPDNAALSVALVPFINVYLQEAAPVLESKRLMETLREANLRDPMTGLNNRRFLEEYVETLLAGVTRRKVHLTLLMLDLDYFKMVNDTYGHDAGDTVLKALAKTLRNAVRISDLVIRYGGEEFVIILQDSDAEHGMQVAENIRAAVEQLKVPIGGGTVLQKTISIGVSDYPEDSVTFWQAIKFADVALYRAKETGRNRVVRFTPDMWNDTQEY